ncbi:DinB family protein [Paraflavitalea speifideaquila]|uniref:DinB family protein n=1 Tax=Paraflavitalea speifideaquila TaxID=3076558 RepID=UPI0028E9697B|nr:DinB family protein [Paraflavitalea speifideiaquila]
MALSVSTTTRLQYQHESIQELIAGLSETQLKQMVQPGKWSAFEQIAHLTAYQPIFLDRLYKIERENSPAFQRYVAEQDALFGTYLQKSLPALLAALADTRLMITNYLTGLTADALQRTGEHPGMGC